MYDRAKLFSVHRARARALLRPSVLHEVVRRAGSCTKSSANSCIPLVLPLPFVLHPFAIQKTLDFLSFHKLPHPLSSPCPCIRLPLLVPCHSNCLHGIVIFCLSPFPMAYAGCLLPHPVCIPACRICTGVVQCALQAVLSRKKYGTYPNKCNCDTLAGLSQMTKRH